MYRTEPHRAAKERLTRVRPLADPRVVAPLGIVFVVAGLVVFNAGSWSATVTVSALGPPPPTPARLGVRDGESAASAEPSQPGIFELDTDFRRDAFAPVARVETRMGRTFEMGRLHTSLYDWPDTATVEHTEGWLKNGEPSSFTTIRVVDAHDRRGGAIGTRVDKELSSDLAALRTGQARVAAELDAWLEGPRTAPFVGSYGDVFRTLPHAIAVAAFGLFFVSLFLLPRVEVWRTATPSLVRVRRGFWRTRELDVDVRDAERIAVRTTSRLGLLVHRLVLRRPGEADVALVPFGTTSLTRAVAMRQRLVDAAMRATVSDT